MKWQSTGGSSSFQNPEPGAYAAVCTRIIDMGTQETTYQGEKKSAHQVKLVFELNELMSDGRPFIATRDFTVSLHEKSGLRKFLAGWRGRDFTDEELGGFDPKKLLGVGCMLTLVEKGKYVNIDSASKLPKGMAAPKPAGELLFLSLEQFDAAVFKKLSEKMQEKIKASPEYQRAIKGDPFADLPSDELEEEAF